MKRTLCALVAVLVFLISPHAALAAAGSDCQFGPREVINAPREFINASRIVSCLKKGQPVRARYVRVGRGFVIPGPTVVEASFRCVLCHFEGDIRASDVTFNQVVDLTESTFAGDVVLRAVRFKGPALLSTLEKRPSEFRAGLNLRLARFDDIVTLDGALIKGRADLTLTRFNQAASFRLTTFRGPALFGSAVFNDDAIFAAIGLVDDSVKPQGTCERGGAFESTVVFRNASFGATADFRSRCFGADATFGSADFAGTVDFPRANFHGAARFEAVRFGRGGSFRESVFSGEASFDRITSDGELDFTAARFKSGATFKRATTQSVSFLRVGLGRALQMDRVKAEDLVLLIAVVLRSVNPDHRIGVLTLIESSAKNRGDIATVNRAHYELLDEIRQKKALENKDPLGRLGDLVFYKWVAGYFVRYSHPLITLAILILGTSLIRFSAWRVRPESKDKPRRWRNRVQAWWRQLSQLKGILWETVGQAFSRKAQKPAGKAQEPAGKAQEPARNAVRLIWVERWVYRILSGLVVICLANSSPVLKQMWDALL